MPCEVSSSNLQGRCGGAGEARRGRAAHQARVTHYEREERAPARVSALDGLYVIRTDVPASESSAERASLRTLSRSPSMPTICTRSPA